ncbi:hypothetical protein GOODEAATRI_020092, partial [Goodea atripinnis]
VISQGPPFINVSLYSPWNISRWRNQSRDISLPSPSACLVSCFYLHLVLSLEPEPDVSLLGLLIKIMKSSLPNGASDSEGFQEPLYRCPGEASTSNLHCKCECSPPSL